VNDGSFGTAYSASVAYEMGPLFATAAYETAQASEPGRDDLAPGSVGIANESAFKARCAIRVAEATKATSSGKKMKRNAITPLLDRTQPQCTCWRHAGTVAHGE